jgi:hypothetical protein
VIVSLKKRKNYLGDVVYEPPAGVVSSGADAEPHEAESAIPAAAAMIEMILISFIYFIIFKFIPWKKHFFVSGIRIATINGCASNLSD